MALVFLQATEAKDCACFLKSLNSNLVSSGASAQVGLGTCSAMLSPHKRSNFISCVYWLYLCLFYVWTVRVELHITKCARMYICLCHYDYMCTSVGSLHSEAAHYIQTNEEKASWSHRRNLHTNNHNKLQFRCLVCTSNLPHLLILCNFMNKLPTNLPTPIVMQIKGCHPNKA